MRTLPGTRIYLLDEFLEKVELPDLLSLYERLVSAPAPVPRQLSETVGLKVGRYISGMEKTDPKVAELEAGMQEILKKYGYASPSDIVLEKEDTRQFFDHIFLTDGNHIIFYPPAEPVKPPKKRGRKPKTRKLFDFKKGTLKKIGKAITNYNKKDLTFKTFNDIIRNKSIKV